MDTTYDANARPTRRTLSASSTTYAVTDMSYDALGRPDCTAVRMNPSAWGTATAACTLQTAGSYGDDRITRRTYDNAGEATLVQTGYGGSGVQADEIAATYRNNGQVETVTDALGNRTTYVYDGHDRLSQTRYPSTTQGAGTSNSSDYEQLSYDAANNVTSLRLRDGNSIGLTYDYLNRLTAKDLPGSELDATYVYDLLGRMTSAATSAQTLSFTFDALGRNLTQVGPDGTVSYAYDVAGRRTQMTYADSGLYVNYDYDTAGDLIAIRENGATSGVGMLGVYAYDDRGRRTSLTRGNGTTTSYSFDSADRLTQIVQDLASTGSDLTLSDSFDPASGIVSHTSSNDAYAWGGHYAVNRNYTANGLNQYTATGSITPTYDTRGNVTSAGSITYGYSSENRLTSASGGVTLSYDPLGRLYQTSGASTTRLGYDGANLIAEYNSSNALQRRYVFGPGTDEPLVWYEGTGTSTRRWFHADERGSIVATSDSSGALFAINTYDEHGIPGASNSGRFQYTGQAWMPEIGMYYYRARIYSPTLGRFLQTDPIGFGGGMNLYAYVKGDPVNFTDPLGLQPPDSCDWCGGPDSVITGSLLGSGPIIHSGLTGRYMLDMPLEYGGGGQATPCGEEAGSGPSRALLAPLPVAEAVEEAVALARFAALSPLALTLFLSSDTPQPQYVVRGGLAAPQNLIDQTSTRADGLTGFSVNTAPGMTVDQIARAAPVRNNQISYTTVQQLERVGAPVVATPTASNPLHATVNVPNPLGSAQAAVVSAQFRQAPNPVPPGCRP